jgi:hypothetical protein
MLMHARRIAIQPQSRRDDHFYVIFDTRGIEQPIAILTPHEAEMLYRELRVELFPTADDEDEEE